MKEKIIDTNKNPNNYNVSISLVRVLAMLLIIQSHSDALFPAGLSFIATGGALGNELFFLVGGYLYSTKAGIIQTTLKRFIRLYIPTYIMTMMLYLFGIANYMELADPKEIIHRMIWPTFFWFVSAIFFDGIILHIIVAHKWLNSKRKNICFLTAIMLFNFIDVRVER